MRHPGTADTILHDFETMLWIAHVASFLPALQSLRLEDTLKQFAAPLKEQVCGGVEVWGVEGCVGGRMLHGRRRDEGKAAAGS